MPLSTVQKVFSGHTKSPRYETQQAIEKVLRRGLESYPGNGIEEYADDSAGNSSLVREGTFPYNAVEDLFPMEEEMEAPPKVFKEKKQGEYTLEDYYALPDERRVELIDGVIYDMTSPTQTHQVITGFIHAELWNFVIGNKGKCVVNIAPTDVHVDTADNKTIVQPDVLVTCDRDKITNPRIEGAPDLVIEVLSPSTRRKDISVKVKKYADAGVRELWLVDPRDRRIIVYDFENEDIIRMYTFQDHVPVLIFGGDLNIDFRQVTEYLNDLLGDSWYER